MKPQGSANGCQGTVDYLFRPGVPDPVLREPPSSVKPSVYPVGWKTCWMEVLVEPDRAALISDAILTKDNSDPG